MFTRLSALTAAIALANLAQAQNLTVLSTSPAANSMALPSASIVLQFDRPLNPSTVTPANVWAFARSGGAVLAPLVLSNGNQTITVDPPTDFFRGEVVTVYISHNLRAADGQFMRGAGYSFQFTSRPAPAQALWRHVETMTTRTIPSQATRSYGGVATDLDRDGWLDLTIINEISADLRVFMNRDDGTGRFFPFLQPTFPIGVEGSPNEPGDFNRDGKIDVAVACGVSNSVSVLFGNGNGTYAPQQTIQVGNDPTGIAVLDCDGDGDQDIITANTGTSNVSRLLNNGSGVFGPAFSWEGGGSGEWSLGAADMTSDGILDIVVGCIGNLRMIVHRCNGDGTFTMLPFQDAGGTTWQIALGDVNGDGSVDVASANSSTGDASILLGNGAGGLAPPVIYPSGKFPIASDLGDLDGDGDLDWVTSAFSGEWTILRNAGNGTFQPWDTIFPTSAASCAILYDADRDGDLDLALIDEIADEVGLYENTCYADCNDSHSLTIADFGCFQAAFGAGGSYADCNQSGTLTIADFSCFQQAFSSGCP